MLNTNLDASDIKMKPIRVLMSFDELDTRYRSIRTLSIDPKDSKDIYGGRMSYLVELKHHVMWYNHPILFFIYERRPKKLITGMARLSPIVWINIPKGEPVVNKIETAIVRSTNAFINDTWLEPWLGPQECYLHYYTVKDSTAYFYLKDRISLDLFRRQAKDYPYVHINEVTKTYRFESTYEPWMLGFDKTDIQRDYIHTEDLSGEGGEPWRVKLAEEIRKALAKLMDDSDIA